MPDPNTPPFVLNDDLTFALEDFGEGGGRETESAFSRDDDDVLIRKERETRDKFRDMVTVVIDGYPVTIPRAVPRTDPQGNFVREADGGLDPRTTTIYDAAAQLFGQDGWGAGELARRIPVLCHQSHQNPVAVCRMCSVQISNPKKGRPERKLLPACQHPVEDGMQVTTRCGADSYNPEALIQLGSRERETLTQTAASIQKSVGLLAEFLLADHRHTPLSPLRDVDGSDRDSRFKNELETVANSLGVAGPRPTLPRSPTGENVRNTQHAGPRDEEFEPQYARARRVELPVLAAHADPEELPDPAARRAWEAWNERIDEEFPYSSRTVVVDHDRCILCDRCVRACSEDKPFKIIGHTGKGYNTRISFDLDRAMGESNCVQCGQCMTYCPTGALSLRRRVQPRAWGDESPKQIPQNPATPFPPAPDPGGAGEARFLTADEMLRVELEYKDPESGHIRRFKPFEGIPYTFLKWNEGAVRERAIPEGETETLCEAGTYGSTAFLLKAGKFQFRAEDESAPPARPGLLRRLLGDHTPPAPKLRPPIFRSPHDLILGEMACMTAERRTGEIGAVGPAVWYEVTRNVLDMIQRTPAARRLLDLFYTPRAIWACLNRSTLFQGALGEDDRKRATGFLGAVNRPDNWVYGKTTNRVDILPDAEVDRLWRELFRPDRISGSEPVTALGYDHREALAKLAETAPAELGLDARVGRLAAADIRLRNVSVFVDRLSPAAAGRVLRELAGSRAFDRWFPGALASDSRPGKLLKFVLVPPVGLAPDQPHPPPPPGLERPALELLLLLNPIQLRRVDAGQAIVTQDDPASDFYMIRLGFVRVQVESGGVSLPVAHRGPNEVFGEGALLERHPTLRGAGGVKPVRGRRLASVVAMDPVEVIRVRGPVFYVLCAVVPHVEEALLERIQQLRAEAEQRKQPTAAGARLRAAGERLPEYLQLGLYQAQKVLVLDLISCTRCDECTRACADSHQSLDGGAKYPRLLREGMRFGDFLVATSCRSCHKPYCMDGCPVDAIHRKGSRLEMQVEAHCIGCGLCERNCPYGSIHMVPKAGADAQRVANPPRRAVNCDLCGPVGGEPYCVSACPHDTAFRMTGEALMDEVLARMASRS